MTDKPPPKPKNLIFHQDFLWFLGSFFGCWASIELLIAYGIGKFLRTSFEETHILTSGMEFGRKATLLRNLVYRSDDQNKKEIIQLIGKLQNESKRNVFAHAYILSNPAKVTFIERTRGGDYRAVAHNYTLLEFGTHCNALTKVGRQLDDLLCGDHLEMNRFALAALNTNTNSTKSPTPPSSKA